MRIPIRTRLLIWWLKKRSSISVQEPPVLAFRRTGSGLSHVLILFPADEKAGRTARYFLKTLFNNQVVNIDVLGRDTFNPVDKITDKVTIKQYSDQDFNWAGGLRKTAQTRIFNHQYDAILDLNPVFNLQSAILSIYSHAAIRVGFKSEFSYNFYNIEIDHKPDSFLELGYKKIQELLSL